VVDGGVAFGSDLAESVILEVVLDRAGVVYQVADGSEVIGQ
jgi:hypothetical protein